MPGSPFLQREGGLCNTDVIDAKIASEQSDWTKEATTYVRDRITPDSRYKLKKFIDDEKLNCIRLDANCFIFPSLTGAMFMQGPEGERKLEIMLDRRVLVDQRRAKQIKVW